MSQTPIKLLLLLLLLGGALLFLIRQQAWLQPLELTFYDYLLQQHADLPPDPRLLIVTIDEADIQAQNRFPLSDQVLAETLAIINQAQPTVIGLDIYRDIPHAPGHAALVEQLQRDNVITIRNMGSAVNRPVPPPANSPATQVAFNDLVLDPDLVLRRYMLYMSDTIENKTIFSFAALVTRRYLYHHHRIVFRDGEHANEICAGAACMTPLQPHSGGYQNIDAQAYQLLLKYRNRHSPAQQVSLSEVLNGRVNPALMRDRIVLIGTTAESAKDIFLTPYSANKADFPYMAGVLIHAQIVSQLLTAALDEAAVADNPGLNYQALFHYWPETAERIWLMVWLILGVILGWQVTNIVHQALLFALGLGTQLGIAAILFQAGVWISIATPLLGYSLMSALSLGYLLLYRSRHDALTHLPNQLQRQNQLRWWRYLWQIQPQRWRNHHRLPVDILLLFDIDNFKVINTALSHKIGDILLLQFSERLQALPKQFTLNRHLVARVGDDEFALLLFDAHSMLDLKQFARQLQYTLSTPFSLDQEEVFISLSIGIARNERPANLSLLHQAHAALYYAKMQTGRGRIELFAGDMQAGTLVAFELERDLRHTLQLHQAQAQGEITELSSHFLVYYQPLIYLASGQIGGFEALVRWHHDQRGLVSPGQFIPIAEETGLIVPIGEWVLTEACRQMVQWCQQFPDLSPFVMSVNLSGVQFALPDLIARVKHILANTGLSPKHLKLEVTESAAMEDMQATIEILRQLKALDIHLSIDDFGTGYSSLSYLTQFPVNTLKVDRSFVDAMSNSQRDMQIVKTIVSLGHHLNMEIIAEGVETAEQLSQLRALHCEYGQGYFFAKPLPQAEAEALLLADQRW